VLPCRTQTNNAEAAISAADISRAHIIAEKTLVGVFYPASLPKQNENKHEHDT
jgi:hypothetical protein